MTLEANPASLLGRSSDSSVRFSGLLLSLCSPVLRAMICGGFREGAARRLVFDDVDGGRSERRWRRVTEVEIESETETGEGERRQSGAREE